MVGGMQVGYELLKVGGNSVFEMEHSDVLKALGQGNWCPKDDPILLLPLL